MTTIPSGSVRYCYREMWAHFDVDGDGSITVEEIANVLIGLGADEAEAWPTAEAMMAVADDSGDGEIEFTEFVEIMAAANKAEGHEEQEEDEEEEDSEKIPWDTITELLGSYKDAPLQTGIPLDVVKEAQEDEDKSQVSICRMSACATDGDSHFRHRRLLRKQIKPLQPFSVKAIGEATMMTRTGETGNEFRQFS